MKKSVEEDKLPAVFDTRLHCWVHSMNPVINKAKSLCTESNQLPLTQPVASNSQVFARALDTDEPSVSVPVAENEYAPAKSTVVGNQVTRRVNEGLPLAHTAGFLR